MRDVDIGDVSGDLDDTVYDCPVYGGGAVDAGGGNGAGGGTRHAWFRSTAKECGTTKGKTPPRWVVS